MNSTRATRILGIATFALFVLIAILWLWPRGSVAPERDIRATAPPGRADAVAATAAAAAAKDGLPAVVEGPTAAELPNPTKYCTTIVDWHRRNVAAWVIEDNMMAQGMKFDEKDFACLTAGGLPPQILDFAEQNTRRPQRPRPRASSAGRLLAHLGAAVLGGWSIGTLWIATAYASEQAAPGGSPISTLLFLIGVVAAAYLLAHLVVERAQQRFLFVSGIEYVGLGIVLGPAVFPQQMQPFQNLTALAPIFAFVAGWVGLLYGLELDLRSLRGEWRPIRIALVDTLVTGSIVTAGAFTVLRSGLLLPEQPWDEAWIAALVLGAAAAAGSSSAIDLLTSRYGGLETELLPMLRKAVRLGDLVAVTAFGLVFCLFHTGHTLTEQPPDAIDWVLLTLGLGLALGLLFFLFLGKDDSESNVFLGMVGILLVASGAAFFLHLSALSVNLVLGAVLAQTSLGGRIGKELDRTAKPVSLVLLVFAGALWHPVPVVSGLVFTVGYIALRVVVKMLASVLATVGTPLRMDLFRGMLSQGNAAVAMAVSFRIVYDGPVADLVYTAILVGTVVSELLSPRMLRGLLVDAGEIREDLGPSVPSSAPAADVAASAAAGDR